MPPPLSRRRLSRQGKLGNSAADVTSVSLGRALRLDAGKAGQLQLGLRRRINAKIRIRNVERLSIALQRAARTGSAEQIRNAVALNRRWIVEVAFVKKRELSFHLSG